MKAKTNKVVQFLFKPTDCSNERNVFHAWNLFELTITLVGIIDVMLIETNSINYYIFDLVQTAIIVKVVRFLSIPTHFEGKELLNRGS